MVGGLPGARWRIVFENKAGFVETEEIAAWKKRKRSPPDADTATDRWYDDIPVPSGRQSMVWATIILLGTGLLWMLHCHYGMLTCVQYYLLCSVVGAVAAPVASYAA